MLSSVLRSDIDTNTCAPKLASRAFDASENAAGFQVERSSVSLHSTADVCDGSYAAMRLPLLKPSAKAIDVGVVVYVERARAVDDGIPVEEGLHGWVGRRARQVSRTQRLPWGS